MPIRDIQRYTELLRQGEQTIPERLQLLKQHQSRVEEHLKEVEQHLETITSKIAYYLLSGDKKCWWMRNTFADALVLATWIIRSKTSVLFMALSLTSPTNNV